jgi:hypothetical protein
MYCFLPLIQFDDRFGLAVATVLGMVAVIFAVFLTGKK